MNIRNKVLVGTAALALLVSGTAMAAVNANELHLALSELKLALVKMGVANAMLANPVPPANNAEAHVAPATELGSNEISAIKVSTGGVINVYLTPAVGVTGGIVQLVPQVVTDKQGQRTVRYTCYSPNIEDIAAAAPGCTYHPVGK